jgi:hypothetical protein
MGLEIVTFPVSDAMTAFISQAFYIEDYIEDAINPHPIFRAYPDLEAFR